VSGGLLSKRVTRQILMHGYWNRATGLTASGSEDIRLAVIGSYGMAHTAQGLMGDFPRRRSIR